MGRFTQISSDAFASIQKGSGMLLKKFNPLNPVKPADEDIITATTGGINPVCQPTYEDFGSDIDNCPENTKELKQLTGWICTLGTTALNTTPEVIRWALGAADVNNNKITPRRDVKLSDFKDLWWVGDRVDGGFVAIRLINALSTGGFSLQTTKSGKGNVALTITGHVSIHDLDTMPMEFYSYEGEEGDVFSVTQALIHVNSTFTGTAIPENEAFTATLTADEGYDVDTVSVYMGEEDVTATAYTTETGVISIAAVTGDIVITAVAETEGA